MINPDNLSLKEQNLFFEEFSDSMWEATPEQENFFAKRKSEGLGVGMDDEGNIIFASPQS